MTLRPPLTRPVSAFGRGGGRWRERGASFSLCLPAALLLVIGFVIPIVLFLLRGIENPEIPHALPTTVAVLNTRWDGTGLPPDAAYEALARDLSGAQAAGLGGLARRLNTLIPGDRSLVMTTARHLREGDASPSAADARGRLSAIDPRWDEREVWAVLRQQSGRYTSSYLLAALDLKRAVDGDVVRTPETDRIFVDLFIRTFTISATVTFLCLLAGFPAAHLMASISARWLPLLMMLVLLPFWTSTLVRSTAWIVLLQDQGLINRCLRALGLIAVPLPLFANRFAVLVAMTHVLLPYMILPLYGAMKAIPPNLMRAATSLGANPWRAFVRVYVPLVLPGIAAGGLLVFILSLGYYVTPALVGGPADQMVSYFIALYTNVSLNWGLASALSGVLLLLTLALYLLLSRFGVGGQFSAP